MALVKLSSRGLLVLPPDLVEELMLPAGQDAELVASSLLGRVILRSKSSVLDPQPPSAPLTIQLSGDAVSALMDEATKPMNEAVLEYALIGAYVAGAVSWGRVCELLGIDRETEGLELFKRLGLSDAYSPPEDSFA